MSRQPAKSAGRTSKTARTSAKKVTKTAAKSARSAGTKSTRSAGKKASKSARAPARKAPAVRKAPRPATAAAPRPAPKQAPVAAPAPIIHTLSPPVQPIVVPDVPVRAHRYHVGDTVYYTSPSFGRAAATGSYTIVKLLPSDGDDYQYRIKSSGEAFERVAKESQLESD